MAEPALQFTISEQIAYLTINSPPKNELNMEFFSILGELINRTISDDRIRGMIVNGKGRHFSTGANVPELLSLSNLNENEGGNWFFSGNADNLSAIESCPFPVVAAVNGCCFGAGLELALACHFRIASSRAVFALPESEFGLMPGCGGTIRLPSLIGKSRAIEMILSGKSVLAENAKKIGLIDIVTEKKNLIDTAEQFLKNYGKNTHQKGEK